MRRYWPGFVIGIGTATAAAAETENALPTASAVPHGLWELLQTSGATGLAIGAMSLAGLAVALELAWRLRYGALVPGRLLAEVEAAVDDGEVERAIEMCREREGLLARMLAAGLAKAPYGAARMSEAMEEEAEHQAALLGRRLGWLWLIASVAPLVGLLGTVAGLQEAFGVLAARPAATPADLAHGVYLALTTTFMGVTVAVPSLAAGSYFRGRAETAWTAARMAVGEVLDRFHPLGGEDAT